MASTAAARWEFSCFKVWILARISAKTPDISLEAAIVKNQLEEVRCDSILLYSLSQASDLRLRLSAYGWLSEVERVN